MPATTAAPQRLDYVDCMRAIAALLVLILHAGELAVHTFRSTAFDSWALTPAFTFDFGRAGVNLFFALSGFVIPASLANSRDKIRFPIRRFFRLYPAYWLSILVSLIVGFWLNGILPFSSGYLDSVFSLARRNAVAEASTAITSAPINAKD